MAATYSSLVGLAIGGKYEIRKVLGAGGMGVVCEAVHLDLGKRVAVKLIDKSMKESELIVARFRREARALGQIQSEHIVDVFDVGADNRVGLYIVMEHLAGEDLQRRLDREKRLDVRTGVMIAHQVARGLAKAHEAGVIHRDLKPANLFLTTRDNGQLLVKILDFGVSKVLGDELGGARITGSGAPIGTPLYMSPEQAEGKDDTDGRADIWSLGAVMYEAMSGTAPFPDRGSYHGTIVGILTSRPKLLFDAAPWIPRDVAAVFDDCLVHDRDARIKHAGGVTQRLLEAYPAVLPDGTGRHTAVIIPQATAAVDATGDTEFFSSVSLPSGRVSSPVDSPRPASSGPKPQLTPATPLEVPTGASSESEALVERETAPPMRVETGAGTKTEPLWIGPSGLPVSPTSSATGVAMPGTPPIIEPLPLSEAAPDTTRDDLLAASADRRRSITLAILAAAIVVVALGGFVLGRRSGGQTSSSAAAPPAASAPALAVTSATPVPAATSATSLPSAAPPVGTASPGGSSAPPSSFATPPHPLPKPETPKARPRAVKPKTAEPTQEETPAAPPPEAPVAAPPTSASTPD